MPSGQLAEVVRVLGGLGEGGSCVVVLILLCAASAIVMVRIEHNVVAVSLLL